jgi:tRNA (cytidine/uridine-2'-O-)-methyltransferase
MGETFRPMADLPRLALYQPDIPQNAGTLLRLGACFGFRLHIIEPCGFLWDDRRMRRAGMDYLDRVAVTRHSGWAAFEAERRANNHRLVLLTTKGGTRLDRFSFTREDVIMVGRESAGVPDEVAAAADIALRIPMLPGLRSLNVALAATLAMGEAMRQLSGYPAEDDSK